MNSNRDKDGFYVLRRKHPTMPLILSDIDQKIIDDFSLSDDASDWTKDTLLSVLYELKTVDDDGEVRTYHDYIKRHYYSEDGSL